ncbi:MAG: AMP-binding protein, partial [Phycisphaeraceae bacterium]
ADYCIMRGIVLESLQRIDTGGAPVFPRTIDKLRAVMPQARLMIVYGSTEAEPIATLDATVQNDPQRARIAGGAGLPGGACASDVQVRLLAARWGEPIGPLSAGQFNAQCVEPGVVGEIVVRGDRVIGGYLNGVGESQTKIHVDGSIWHRTGDLGRFDDEGQLWLLGRASAQLRDQRGAIEPLAVEAAAMEQTALTCCALVAIRGERVLVVQIAADAGDGWRERLLDDLAWAQIDRVMTLRRIPLDGRHNAKINYPSLRRLVGADSPSALSTTRAVPAAPSISTRSPS